MQEIDFGAEHQLVFELRPAHDPTKAYGFVNCVVSLKDLSSSIWTWYRDGDRWAVRKVIDIPAEPADPDQLPPALKDFKACPPLVTDIDLSVDDKYLYVSCWGTGTASRLTADRRWWRSAATASAFYFTNSLYGAIDGQFYPEGLKGWMVKVDARAQGGIELDEDFFVEWTDGYRPHQV